MKRCWELVDILNELYGAISQKTQALCYVFITSQLKTLPIYNFVGNIKAGISLLGSVCWGWARLELRLSSVTGALTGKGAEWGRNRKRDKKERGWTRCSVKCRGWNENQSNLCAVFASTWHSETDSGLSPCSLRALSCPEHRAVRQRDFCEDSATYPVSQAPSHSCKDDASWHWYSTL